MSVDWNDFLAEDLFENPAWPSTTEQNSDIPASKYASLSAEQTPIFDYPPFDIPGFEPQYNAVPYTPSSNVIPLQKKVPRTSKTLRRGMEEALPSIEPEDSALDTSKRNRNGMDNISACWTSPLCPNHSTEDGTHPDPLTCGAACAPFLFTGPGDSLSTALDEAFLSNEIRIEPESQDLSTEITPERPLKRSESDSDDMPKGRTNTHPTKSKPKSFRKDESISQGDETSPDVSYDVAESTGNRKTSRRQPHNQVERKYRESLNTQLESLRKVVPSLRPDPQHGDGTTKSQTADIEDLPMPTKPSKAVVLASATAYIRQMEKEKKQMADENKLLKSRISALQALVKCDDCSLMQYVMNLNLAGKQ